MARVDRVFWGSHCWLMGIILPLALSHPMQEGVIILIIVGMVVWVWQAKQTSALSDVLTACALFICAVLWSAGYIGWLWWQVAAIPLQQKINAEWVIAGPVHRAAHFVHFDAVLVRVGTVAVSAKVDMRCYRCEDHFVAGSHWRSLIVVRGVHSLSNPGGHDSGRQLFARGILRVATIVPGQHVYLGYQGHRLLRWRQRAGEHLWQACSYLAHGGLILALALGDISHVSTEDWQVFRDSGTAHLLAISGLHIGLVAGGVVTLVSAAWSVLPANLLTRITKRWMWILSFWAGAAYSACAGFSYSTQRALCMWGVYASKQYAGWMWPVHTGLSLSVVMITLYQPLAVLSPGFWLSVTAVAYLGQITRIVAHRVWWQRVLLLPLWMSAATLSISVFVFGQYPWLSGLANMVAIPWFSFFVVPWVLGGCVLWPFLPGISGILWSFANASVTYLIVFLHLLSHCSVCMWHPAYYNEWWHGCLAVVASIALLWVPGGMGKAIGVLGMLPWIVPQVSAPAWGGMDVHVWDVGQGLSVLVQTARHNLLYDTGPPYGPDNDAGKRVIVPALHYLGIKRLDGVVVSHLDADHVGGLRSILAQYVPDRVYSSQSLARYGAHHVDCFGGDRWQWDGVTFSWLSPASIQTKRNNRSCVLHITSADHSVLLPGDIERRVERDLVAHHRQDLKSEILLAPHHGSKTSSSVDFIQAVGAKIVVFAVGWHNRFHLPHPKIIARYQQSGATLYDLPDTGALTLHLPPHHSTAQQGHRVANRWYSWQRPPVWLAWLSMSLGKGIL